MTRLGCAICLCAAATACVEPPGEDGPDRELLRYSFETVDEGWRITGDAESVAPRHVAEGGVRGGFIAADDQALGGVWRFSAPDPMVRRLREARHGRLTFHLRQSDTSRGFESADVVIESEDARYAYRFDSPPGESWTRYEVRLEPFAGWRNEDGGRPDADAFAAALSDATALTIRGEYRTGPDEGGLDEVVLYSGAAPERVVVRPETLRFYGRHGDRRIRVEPGLSFHGEGDGLEITIEEPQ